MFLSVNTPVCWSACMCASAHEQSAVPTTPPQHTPIHSHIHPPSHFSNTRTYIHVHTTAQIEYSLTSNCHSCPPEIIDWAKTACLDYQVCMHVYKYGCGGREACCVCGRGESVCQCDGGRPFNAAHASTEPLPINTTHHHRTRCIHTSDRLTPSYHINTTRNGRTSTEKSPCQHNVITKTGPGRQQVHAQSVRGRLTHFYLNGRSSLEGKERKKWIETGGGVGEGGRNDKSTQKKGGGEGGFVSSSSSFGTKVCQNKRR